MINVYIHYKNGRATGFEAVGHANYAPAGKDIVCAAVSALTNTLEATLDDMELGYDQIEPTSATDVLFRAYRIGIETIAENYPENVKLHLAE